MKKLIKLGALITATVILCACGNKASVNEQAPEGGEVAQQDNFENIKFDEMIEKNHPVNLMKEFDYVIVKGTYIEGEATLSEIVYYSKDGNIINYDYYSKNEDGRERIINIYQGTQAYIYILVNVVVFILCLCATTIKMFLA